MSLNYDESNKITKDELVLKYPEGTKLRLTKPLNDKYSPKKTGDVLTVSYIDDRLQIHGSWESGGSLALIYGVDSFKEV